MERAPGPPWIHGGGSPRLSAQPVRRGPVRLLLLTLPLKVGIPKVSYLEGVVVGKYLKLVQYLLYYVVQRSSYLEVL